MTHTHSRQDLKPIAKTLRKGATDSERILWKILRNKSLGVKFRRQEPIGNYIVDFVCHECKIIIEADGSQHNENPHDLIRDEALTKQGYTVLRFWNNEILEQRDAVIEHIRHHLPLSESSTEDSTPPPGGSELETS